MSIHKKTLTRTPLPPATGAAKWYGTAPNGNPFLWIRVGNEVKVYEVEEAFGEYRLYRPTAETPMGYTCYYVDPITDPVGWTCTCPDATTRPERRHECKHVRALRKVLPTMPTPTDAGSK